MSTSINIGNEEKHSTDNKTEATGKQEDGEQQYVALKEHR